MAEARSEEEEENMMRDSREQVVRRQPNRGRPDRRKPEQRHSQGPLSSIRAVIKRTSSRPTSVSETSRDRDRERERDRDRDRRRPEITILSAEPLAATSWFPGASAGFPPPPPPPAQIWGSTIPPSIQPPPSYEEVIREKTQEQVLPPTSSSTANSSSSHLTSTITIATQTDPGSDPDPTDSQVGRPQRPSRPPLPCPADDITSTSSQSALTSVTSDGAVPDTSVHTQCCDLVSEPSPPLTSSVCAQTDQPTAGEASAPPTTSSRVALERPRPRPRSKFGVQRISDDVKVQTLVKLREDGLATLAARAQSDTANQDASHGKYLQELLEAFSSDDWGFPEQRSDGSEDSQSESEEGDEDEDMATLKARIQAFEQQQQVADGRCGDSDKDLVATRRPEPRPRPRLQPTKSAPPTIAPKPQNVSHAPKPSSKTFWEDGGLTANSGGSEASEASETLSADINPASQIAAEASPPSAPKPAPASVPQPSRSTEKPLVAPKPPSAAEPVPSGISSPVPAPRPPPPKLLSSLTDAPSSATPKPPPRPTVAPRVSMGSPHKDKCTTGQATPALPPRPSVEVGGGKQSESQTESGEMQDAANHAVKVGSVRPVILSKPAALSSPRRVSAPNLTPKPTGALPAPTDPNPVPAKPAAASVPATRPSGPAPAAVPGLKPPTPAPALRKGPVIQTKAEATSAANSTDPPLPPRPTGAKMLPLRPPPIKSSPGRPPPPAVNSTSNQIHAPSKTKPAPSGPSPQTSSSPPSSQKVQKKGPPLPPRPKPGHLLYNSYMKQEVLIVLDEPSAAPAARLSGEGKSPNTVTPPIDQSLCLLDLDTQPEAVPEQDSQSKSGWEALGLSRSQVSHLPAEAAASILPVHPAEHKDQPDPPPVSGPRCVALFDYEGEEDDELTFSQEDVIALQELVGDEWGRGQIHGRTGIFPLNFTKVVEPLPQPATSPGDTTKGTSPSTAPKESTASPKAPEHADSEMCFQAEEWAVALFDFPGQTAEDLSFHKGALIRVVEHVDAEWSRGRLEGREGLYPAAFTQPSQVQPVPGQQPLVRGAAKALFDFTAESEDELSLKVGDILTQVESVDEEWILGVLNGKRGIIPKNYISFL